MDKWVHMYTYVYVCEHVNTDIVYKKEKTSQRLWEGVGGGGGQGAKHD